MWIEQYQYTTWNIPSACQYEYNIMTCLLTSVRIKVLVLKWSDYLCPGEIQHKKVNTSYIYRPSFKHPQPSFFVPVLTLCKAVSDKITLPRIVLYSLLHVIPLKIIKGHRFQVFTHNCACTADHSLPSKFRIYHLPFFFCIISGPMVAAFGTPVLPSWYIQNINVHTYFSKNIFLIYFYDVKDLHRSQKLSCRLW